MKVNIIKPHPHYPLGEAEVTEERGKYLITVGIAEEVKEKKEISHNNEKKVINKPGTKKK